MAPSMRRRREKYYSCTPLVFHFDVLLRIEIIRVWQHLLDVPFKNWIKKKICRVRGKEGEQRDKCLIFMSNLFYLFIQIWSWRRVTTRFNNNWKYYVITLKLEIDELNSLTERWQRNGRKLQRWIKICSSFGNWHLNDRWRLLVN